MTTLHRCEEERLRKMGDRADARSIVVRYLTFVTKYGFCSLNDRVKEFEVIIEAFFVWLQDGR